MRMSKFELEVQKLDESQGGRQMLHPHGSFSSLWTTHDLRGLLPVITSV